MVNKLHDWLDKAYDWLDTASQKLSTQAATKTYWWVHLAGGIGFTAAFWLWAFDLLTVPKSLIGAYFFIELMGFWVSERLWSGPNAKLKGESLREQHSEDTPVAHAGEMVLTPEQREQLQKGNSGTTNVTLQVTGDVTEATLKAVREMGKELDKKDD